MSDITPKNYFQKIFEKNLERLQLRHILCFGLILFFVGGTFGSPISLNHNTIAFASPNNPPVANDDSATTKVNTPVSINVLANDNDPDGDSITITSATNGENGQAEVSFALQKKWITDTSDGENVQNQDFAVDSSGNVYVTYDTSVDDGVVNLIGFNDHIQKFDSNGNLLTEWGSTCYLLFFELGCVDPDGSGPLVSGDGQFISPQGIAVDSSGNVYVADSFNDRIQKFDSNGNFLTKWGSFGSDDGQLNKPSGVAVDSSGNVYVADSGNSRIQKFDSNGNFLTKWGSFGSAAGQLNYPTGVAVDSSGNVYVADLDNNRIQKFQTGKIIYTPFRNFLGDDSFTYTISDIFGVPATGTVFVTVTDAPIITGIVADDPDGSDTTFSNDDTITVKFSDPTNQPLKSQTNNQLTKDDLDSLFTFSQNIGSDYAGAWIKRSALLITIKDSTGGNPIIGGLTLTVKESANLQNIQETSQVSRFTSPPLSGSFGVFSVSAPIVNGTSFSVLPAGTEAQIELEQSVLGEVFISRTSLSTAGSDGTLEFIGNVIDIEPPKNSCTTQCFFTFILDQEDLDNASLTLGDLRIYHDKNNDGDVADDAETLVPTITSVSPEGPFIVTASDDSTSKFAVGGIKPVFLVAGLGGGGGSAGGGRTAPIFNTFSVIGAKTQQEDGTIGFGGILSQEIQLSNKMPTSIVEAGNEIQLRILLYDNSVTNALQHIALYTNLHGKELIDKSDTYVEYNKGTPIKIVNKNGFLKDADVSFVQRNNNVEAVFSLTFAKPMDISNIVVRAWDSNRNSRDAIFFDAIKVEQDEDVVVPSNLLPVQPELKSDLVKMDPEPLLSIPILKQWAGFSEDSISDEEFLKNLGLEGTKMPSWFKKSQVSKWVIDETISQRELLDTLKFFEESGLLR